MERRKIVIPKRYLKKDRTGKTIYIQSKSTGQMQGRKSVIKSRQDNTRSMRLTQDFDINRNKKIEDNEVAGTIHGRGIVKGDNRKRGTIRRF
jgi:hypothetical protein